MDALPSRSGGRVDWVGPQLICDTLSVPRLFPKSAKSGALQREWQYHPRSDDHSAFAALGVAIDLLRESAALRSAVASGQVGYQINPKMRDRTNREKTLDLSLGFLDDSRGTFPARPMRDLLTDAGVVVSPLTLAAVEALPDIPNAPLKRDLIVLENKACMTKHSSAGPRLRNELEGAADAINNSDMRAVAGALVLVNAADTYYSPTEFANGHCDVSDRRAKSHNQPNDASKAVQKLREIPLRPWEGHKGYDALGILVIDLKNDLGSPCTLVDDPAFGSPRLADIWSYTRMVQELAKRFEQRLSL